MLNPAGDELSQQIIQMNDRRARVKLAKKEAKAIADKVKSEPVECVDEPSTSGVSKDQTEEAKSSSKHGKRALTSDAKLENGQPDKKNLKPSIQNDPNTSKVYKGLFTTSAQAKKKEVRGGSHWVTFNPAYF